MDGGPAEEVAIPTGDTTIWSADALSDTWHTLRIEAGSGTVTLDDVRVTRIAVAEPGRSCSCGEPGPAAAFLLPLPPLRRPPAVYHAPMIRQIRLALLAASRAADTFGPLIHSQCITDARPGPRSTCGPVRPRSGP